MSESSPESLALSLETINNDMADYQERWRNKRMSEEDFSALVTIRYLAYFIQQSITEEATFETYEIFRAKMLERMKNDCPNISIPGSSMYRNIDQIILSRDEFEENKRQLIKQ